MSTVPILYLIESQSTCLKMLIEVIEGDSMNVDVQNWRTLVSVRYSQLLTICKSKKRVKIESSGRKLAIELKPAHLHSGG